MATKKLQVLANLGPTDAKIKSTVEEYYSKHPIDSTLIDKLAPAFTESGSAVVCEPVAGYPMKVVSRIELVQAGSGDPSPDNIRPISGRTDVTLYHRGKNLFQYNGCASADWGDFANATLIEETETGCIVQGNNGTGNGDMSFSNGYLNLGQYPAAKNKAIFLKAGAVVTLSMDVCLVETPVTYENPRFAVALEGTQSCGWTYRAFPEVGVRTRLSQVCKVPVDGTYYPCMTLCSMIWQVENIQIEVGDEATAFEPYREESTELTLELGQTVYGGSLDWQTGALTVDRKMITLDGSEYWLEQSTNTADKNRYGLRWANNQQLLEGAYACLKPNVKDDRLLCSKMKTGTADDTYMCKEGISTYFTANQTYIYIYLEQYATDFEGFKKMMRGAQIVFGLKELITIQLPPQEILALSGTNTLYSDIGDTEVSGRADINTVVEKLTNAIVALGGTV